MADISSWSPVDASNNASPPNGWPENMLPSAVNDCARAMMGAIRRNYDQIISGGLSSYYLPIAGGTITGALTVNGELHSGSITTGGSITASTATIIGDITAGGFTSINTSGNCNASAYYCDSMQIANTSAVGTPGGPVTVPTLYNEAFPGIHLYSQNSHYYSEAHAFQNAAGTTSAPVSASAFTVVSDARLKQGIEPSPEGLPEVLKLNPKSFKRLHSQERETGFIAQEVEAVLPQAVTSLDLNGEATLAINDMPILAALVNAVQEISKRLDSLEAR